jgi:hypothetical protein
VNRERPDGIAADASIGAGRIWSAPAISMRTALARAAKSLITSLKFSSAEPKHCVTLSAIQWEHGWNLDAEPGGDAMSTVTVIGVREVIVAEEDIYVSRSELHNKYQWSDTMIRRYLGPPDLVEERSSVYGRYTIHLFLRTRILSAQAAPWFRPRRAQSYRAQIALLLPPGRRLGAHRWRDLALARWDAGEDRKLN